LHDTQAVLRIRIMKQIIHFIQTLMIMLAFTLWLFNGIGLHAYAATPPAMIAPAGLSISQLKVTGDEFIVLTNNTGATISNLSSYWLYTFNNVNPLAAGVSSSSQQLPTTSLGAGQTILLSSNGMATCGAAAAGKLSVSLGDSTGFLQLVQMGMSANNVIQTSVDSVSWSSGASGTVTGVPSNSKDPNALYYRYQIATGATPTTLNTPAYSWELADLDNNTACKYNVTIGTANAPIITMPNGLNGNTSVPPVTIEALQDTGVSSTDDGSPSVGIPANDIGLLAPVINELLPNPASPQSDTTDEFIELYNPNDASFDLTGFSIQVGSAGNATTHVYAFPTRSILKGKTFMAYASAITKLSLSNNAGQAWLLDGFGNVVGQSAPYSTAKEGQSWALANGSWYWSTTPTPNAVNRMTAPAKKVASKSTPKAITKPTAKKMSTATPKNKKTTPSKASTGRTTDVAAVSPRPIHNTVLVAVAMLAVLYGAYEYRHDIANAFYRLRTNRTNRRGAREKVERGRSN
jgi:hypothetical protein